MKFNNYASLRPKMGPRRRSDEIVRWRMLWAAIGSVTINLALYLALFELNLFDPLLSFMSKHSIVEDKVSIFLLVALTTIIFLLLLYNFKVKTLLRDIHYLLEERETERKALVQHQKLEALGLIAAGISHEINGSLQIIPGSCEMARNRINDKAGVEDFIQRAIDNSLHARRIINNVLTFSNTHGSQTLEKNIT